MINLDYTVAFFADNPASARLLFMFLIMVVSILAGHQACTRFGLRETYSKNIMSFVLICLEWVIVLLVTWQMELDSHFIWLPIIGVFLLLGTILIAVNVFRFSKLDEKRKLTLMLAGGLSNLGYTGGLFVIYPIYGFQGLGVASLLLTLYMPTTCFIFFPYFKARQLQSRYSFGITNLRYLLDWRMLIIPAAITGILLNIYSIQSPAFIKSFGILDSFVYTASALSFFAIGMRLKFSKLKNYAGSYLPLAGVKFLLLPAVTLSVFWVLGIFGFEVDSIIKNVIFIFSICPSAVMMVTISNIFDLDAEMASSLWAVTNISFVLVIVPILFLILR